MLLDVSLRHHLVSETLLLTLFGSRHLPSSPDFVPFLGQRDLVTISGSFKVLKVICIHARDRFVGFIIFAKLYVSKLLL